MVFLLPELLKVRHVSQVRFIGFYFVNAYSSYVFRKRQGEYLFWEFRRNQCKNR